MAEEFASCYGVNLAVQRWGVALGSGGGSSLVCCLWSEIVDLAPVYPTHGPSKTETVDRSENGFWPISGYSRNLD
jgi:hypothetical protein